MNESYSEYGLIPSLIILKHLYIFENDLSVM